MSELRARTGSNLRMRRLNLPNTIGLVLVCSGALALITSILFESSILAFIGLGLTLWGILLFLFKQERYVKSKLLDHTAVSSLQNLSKITAELNYKGKPVFLPPKYFKDFKSGIVYIPRKEGDKTPSSEEISEEKLFSKNPQGMCIISPGLSLTNLYEKETGTSFVRADLEYLKNNLPKLFIETLEIAQGLEIDTQDNLVKVKIEDSVFRDLCRKAQKLPNLCGSIGCPLCSSIASALTRATGRSVVIEKNEYSENDNTINVQYRLLEE